MELYKAGQGKNYRVAFAAIILLTGLYAAYHWYMWSGTTLFSFALFENLDKTFGDLVPGLKLDAVFQWGGASILILLAGFSAFYFAFVSKKAGNYVLDTEEEMRKVTWPSREELFGSAVVVVAVMVILGAITTVMDLVFVRVLEILK